MNGRYILKDGEPCEVDDVLEWARWYETADRTVAKTDIGEAHVSTVFLSLDLNFQGGLPILYETLVFGGQLDGEKDRYHTLEESMIGHERMVARVRAEAPA